MKKEYICDECGKSVIGLFPTPIAASLMYGFVCEECAMKIAMEDVTRLIRGGGYNAC